MALGIGRSVWMDRAVVALVTILVGVAAQSLLAWREIAVLSAAVVSIQKNVEGNRVQDRQAHLELLHQIDATDQNQRTTAAIQAALLERVEAVREDIRDHREHHRNGG